MSQSRNNWVSDCQKNSPNLHLRSWDKGHKNWPSDRQNKSLDFYTLSLQIMDKKTETSEKNLDVDMKQWVTVM